MTLKKTITQILKEKKDLFTTHNAYVFPDIPEAKLKAVKENQIFGKNEDILWVVDLTLGGSATDSLVFTESGIYFRTKIMGVVTEKSVLWAEIVETFYDKKRGFVIVNSKGNEIEFERMNLDVFYKKETDLIDARLKLFEKIKEFIKFKPQEVPVSDSEKEYINDIKFMLHNDGIIEKTEKNILSSLKKNYNLTEQRAEELIKSVVEGYENSPEKQFLDEVYKILEVKNEISESEQRAIDFFAQKLNISEEISEKLMQIALKRKSV